MGAELGEPRRVRDVGLAPGDALYLTGVHEHHLEGAVLQEVVEGLPVVRGRLHHYESDLGGDEVVFEREYLARRRAPSGHR